MTIPQSRQTTHHHLTLVDYSPHRAALIIDVASPIADIVVIPLPIDAVHLNDVTII